MKNLFLKEIKLSCPIVFIFILFSLLIMAPGYPILVAPFFVCLGIFQNFQIAFSNNDILYSVLLPVKKTDVVKAKYIFTIFIEGLAFLLMFLLCILRMTLFSKANIYTQNVMMNANQTFLGFTLILFAIFNHFFYTGFFKTARYYGKPFIFSALLIFLLILFSEILHHLPDLEFLNQTDSIKDLRLWIFLGCCVLIFIFSSIFSCKKAMENFNKVDM